MINTYQAKYYSYELSKRCSSDSTEKFGATLLDAKVDLNPHQVEAALFAFKSPLSKGAILADEVGLGKTIEAGILLSQKWAEGRRRILIISPSSLRKQWSQELADKFYLPSTVIETRSFNNAIKRCKTNPFDNTNNIIICSYHFARNKAEWVQLTSWDLVIIDEAHYLRNSYKPSNVIGNTLRSALDGKRKILLTATPLQNSILELYGLTSFIDENVFGDIRSFRSQFARAGEIDFEDLRDRIAPICNRTLRRQVQEYINYTNRIPLTEQFVPSDEEHALYELVTEYLQKERLYALPASQRHLMTLILRKLLASSSFAISGTLENLIKRLNAILKENYVNLKQLEELDSNLSEDFELFDELQDEAEESNSESNGEEITDDNVDVLSEEQIEGIKEELKELEAFYELANSIQHNAKGARLLVALSKGFEKLKELGAHQKAIIFTESRRTQSYLHDLLENNGYKGKIALFNGTNNDEQSKLIYKSWFEHNKNSDKITGSKPVDIRAALVDHFKSDDCQILLATEAAAEGINLQFCSMLVNYDLPWNPQRIEQRIGRCHRYGQKYDVVVVNFLNTRNAADQRVFSLLNEKFNLFDGVFGASDEVLGSISSGVDFEKRIAEIYQTCRTKDEIESSFDNLQKELEEQIDTKIKTTQQKLLEHFDADVIDKLKTRLDEAKRHVSKYEQWLWEITKLGLNGNATFDSQNLSFSLNSIPFRDKIKSSIPTGPYTLEKFKDDIHRYRIGHPIAQYLIEEFKSKELDETILTFNYSDTKLNVSSIEHIVGKSGIIHLSNFEVTSFDVTDNLLFVGFTDDGTELANEVCKRILELPVDAKSAYQLTSLERNLMTDKREKHKDLLLEALQAKDTEYFQLEVDKLHKWAEDKILASEKELKDVKAKVKEINRDSKKTSSSEALLKMQTELRELERKKKRLRQEIFEVEDEIEERRDDMINSIKAKMFKAINESSIFTIKWKLV
jgi:superfamily II DNA/RNA helicase